MWEQLSVSHDDEKSSIVADYLNSAPSVETSQAIVNEMAKRRNVPVARIRSILVVEGVYLSQIRIRSEILDRDREKILEEFKNFQPVMTKKDRFI